MAENENKPEQARDERRQPPYLPNEAAEAVPETDIGSLALADAFRKSFWFLVAALILFLAVYVLQGIFTVPPDRVKIKLAFGRPVKVGDSYIIRAESGYHICWPWEEVITIPITEHMLVLDKEFWFNPKTASKEPAGEGPEAPGLNVKEDGYAITGDVNVVHLKLRVRYHVEQSEQGIMNYAFCVRDKTAEKKGENEPEPPPPLLTRLFISSVVEVVGSWSVMDVFRKTRVVPGDSEGEVGTVVFFDEEIARELRKKLEEFKRDNHYSAGIEIRSVELIEDPLMPRRVRAAWDEAQKAESERDKMVTEAHERSTRIKAEAEGRRAEVLAQARAYKDRLEVVARADAANLEKLMEAYDTSPAMASILRERHYQRVMEELLGQARDSFVLHRQAKDGRREIRFMLAPPPVKGKKAEKQPESSATQR
jgi:regulator of protease activity HflC (stomatin/prohibitin superfamily)